jgi:flagellar biosynthesis protein FlhB
MSDKTEDPTPKRLREARKKGQVPKSQDATQAFLFLIGFNVLLAIGGNLSQNLKGFLKKYIELSTTTTALPTDALYNIFTDSITFLLINVAPMLGAIMLTALVINYAQVGSLFTFETIKPSLNKINPFQGIKKWFSPATFIELLKTLIKFAIVIVLAYMVIKGLLREMVLSVGRDLQNVNFLLKELISAFTKRVAVVFVIIAAADYFLQKKMMMKNLKMSKDEIKREYKQDEGDPMFKHKRKELAHELIFNNMMKKARKASAVVVNPIHMAAAIQYERGKSMAPVVVAKGKNLIAEQLKEIAREEGIPIIRNISLAQALNRVELDEPIPEQLYQAVAEVLNFVYKLEQQQGRRKKRKTS